MQGNEVDLVAAFIAFNTVTKCTQVQDFLDFYLRNKERERERKKERKKERKRTRARKDLQL